MGRCEWIAARGRCGPSFGSQALRNMCPVACGVCEICRNHAQFEAYAKLHARTAAANAEKLAAAAKELADKNSEIAKLREEYGHLLNALSLAFESHQGCPLKIVQWRDRGARENRKATVRARAPCELHHFSPRARVRPHTQNSSPDDARAVRLHSVTPHE